MSIIEQIKAEIERLKKAQEVSEDYDYAQYELDVSCGYDMACDDILSFLSTLKLEKSIDGLEEEIKRWWGEEYMKNTVGLPILPIVQGIARHFAEWQKEQDDKLVDIIYQQGIEKGKDDMKEQMMSEAVEGEFLYTPYPTIELDDCKDYNFKDFDKVRVIVLQKEDEK